MAYSTMAGNLQTARTQVADVEYFAEDRSYSVSCVSYVVGHDAREGRELAEPSTLLPSRVLQGEGVWKWSRSMCRYVVTRTMWLTMTVTGPSGIEPGGTKSELTAVDDASSPGVLLPALEFPEVLLDEVNLGPTVSPLLLLLLLLWWWWWCWKPPGPGP
jgi:hypothetical protein